MVAAVNTLWDFREALIAAKALDKAFERLDRAINAAGYLPMGGQIIDATLVAAPKQRSTDGERPPSGEQDEEQDAQQADLDILGAVEAIAWSDHRQEWRKAQHRDHATIENQGKGIRFSNDKAGCQKGQSLTSSSHSQCRPFAYKAFRLPLGQPCARPR